MYPIAVVSLAESQTNCSCAFVQVDRCSASAMRMCCICLAKCGHCSRTGDVLARISKCAPTQPGVFVVRVFDTKCARWDILIDSKCDTAANTNISLASRVVSSPDAHARLAPCPACLAPSSAEHLISGLHILARAAIVSIRLHIDCA